MVPCLLGANPSLRPLPACCRGPERGGRANGGDRGRPAVLAGEDEDAAWEALAHSIQEHDRGNEGQKEGQREDGLEAAMQEAAAGAAWPRPHRVVHAAAGWHGLGQHGRGCLAAACCVPAVAHHPLAPTWLPLVCCLCCCRVGAGEPGGWHKVQ